MRVHFISIFGLLAVLVSGLACEPSDKCGGKHYYDPMAGACRACPANATFEDGTCVCPAGMEFENNRCQKGAGASNEPPAEGSDGGGQDAGGQSPEAQDAGGKPMPAGARCDDYCAFTKGCWADNSIAAAVLPEVVTGMHGDDPAACLATCETASSDDDTSIAAVACIAEGTEQAACLDVDTPEGLMGATALLADCCGSRSDSAICKEACAALQASSLSAGMATFCN